MNPTVPPEAIEFGAVAERAFADLGGIDVARRAEAVPDLRRQVGPVLDDLGIGDLDPTQDTVAAVAAAELCRAAGRVTLPYPVVAAVLRASGGGRPVAVVAPDRGRVDHGDLFPAWHLVTTGGEVREGSPDGPALGSRLGPFVTDLARGPGGAGDPAVAWMAFTLGAFWILGVVDRAIELAVAHVNDRVQFGRPLAAFQAVQFALADASVAANGLRELAQFTLWRLAVAPEAAPADVLALRVHAQQVAAAVLRTAQQLHGAAGVCDEYDISVLCRHVQPALRLPAGLERTTEELIRAVDRVGFHGIYPHPPTEEQP
ncbi:MAG TPA: acyl-CoA dehydrogenase family protein [Acidimicrobiales bacterium]